MLRADLLAKNAPIFKATGEALEKHAKRDVKVIVVANPANTNCLTCATHAPSIPKENFCALTRLDMNRARAQLTAKLGLASSSMVKNVVIWGNHSKTMVPDINSATLCANGRMVPLNEALTDKEWLEGSFTSTIQ